MQTNVWRVDGINQNVIDSVCRSLRSGVAPESMAAQGAIHDHLKL